MPEPDHSAGVVEVPEVDFVLFEEPLSHGLNVDEAVSFEDCLGDEVVEFKAYEAREELGGAGLALPGLARTSVQQSLCASSVSSPGALPPRPTEAPAAG